MAEEVRVRMKVRGSLVREVWASRTREIPDPFSRIT
jgi:hypothetical protein